MNTIIRYVLLLALLTSSAFAQKQIFVDSSTTAPKLQSDILIPPGKKVTQDRADLSTGTALTVGTHYYASWSGNKTLSLAGATTLEGGATSVRANISAVMRLTFPAAKRSGETNSPITFLDVYPGIHTFAWVRIGGELNLFDTVGVLNNFTATTDPTTGTDSSLAYTKGSIWINTTSNAVFFCADPTTSAAVWKNITAAATTLPSNAQTGTTYTPVLGDKGKLITLSNASSIAVTIPLNASVAFSAGPTDVTVISFLQIGAGVATITPASGATLNGLTTGISTVANIPLQIIQTAANTWYSTSALAANDTAFAASWDGKNEPPTKNAVYDYAHLADTDDDGLPNKLDVVAAAGFPYTNSGGVIGGSRVLAPGSTKITIANTDGSGGNPTIDSALVVAPTFAALTDGATISSTCDPLKVSQNWTVTLGGNRTLGTPTALAAGMTGMLIVKQDATGSRTLVLWSGSKVISGGSGAVTLTTTANATDVLTWAYDGTNTFWTYGKNFN